MKYSLPKRNLKLIALGLLGVAVLSVFQEKLCIKIDTTVIILLSLAVIVYILPYLTKIQYKDWTIEIEKQVEQEVDKLEKLVIAEENEGVPVSKSLASQADSWQQYYKEYDDILSSGSSNLEKILRASQLIERMIINAGQVFELTEGQLKRNPTQIVRDLRQKDLISEDELRLYQEFMAVRNKIIHGEIKEMSNALTTRILDLLWRMVRIFA